MDSSLIIYVFSAYLIAGFIKGISGLGFSTVCVGIMASFIELTTAIPLVVVPSIASCLLVMFEAGKFREAIREFSAMYLCTVPGLLMGLWLLLNTESQIAKSALGAVLCVYGVWGLINPQFQLQVQWARILRGPTGLVTGTIHGLTGAAVIPVVPYLLSLRLQGDLFVQAVNISFVMSGVILFVVLGNSGYVDLPKLALSIAGILPVALAVKFGGMARRRLSSHQFRTAVLVVLLGLGANLIVFARAHP